MILDTSAVIAILRNEEDAPAVAHAIDRADTCRMSAVNYVEAAVVIDSGGSVISRLRFDDFFREAPIVIESVTAKQAEIARNAYRDFGKGHHKAGLNFGDCFAYALAKETGEPLLFKGRDFGYTDIDPVKI